LLQRTRARDEKTYMVYLAVSVICQNSSYHKIYLRRWGSRNHVKAYKLGLLLKKEDPLLYNELFKYFRCNNGSHKCLGKSIWGFLLVKFKSMNIDIDSIETVGDLCNELHRLKQIIYSPI